ncbi:MAG: hypothetical protein H7838_13705 [Magnetococcus sp. DMHC-8]
MFKKLQLTFHLFTLYGLLGVFLLVQGIYCLFIIDSYDETIRAVDREQFPLSRVVTEITRHQLDQTLRFNEVLFFARVGDREKFEVSNEKFVQAGKRFGDEILEGRNIAQKGMEMARSEARLKEIDAIKTLLKGIEKSHSDYEHLGALLIRGIYQYDFLSKSDNVLSEGQVAAEEEANKHMAFLKTNLSALEDETRRLEGGLKDVMERVKQLPQFLAIDSGRQRDQALRLVLPWTLFALAGGVLLVLFIARIQQDREQDRNRVTGQALHLLTDALGRLQQAFQEWGMPGQQLEQLLAGQQGACGQAVILMQQLIGLSDTVLLLVEQLHTMTGEEQQALKQAGQLIQQLNKGAELLLEIETETGRTIRQLRDTTRQINLLATNASAEAFRSDATRSFAVFTEEIKELARANVVAAEAVANRTDDAIKHIRTDQLHVSQTHRRFASVTELAGREVALGGRMADLLRQQPALLRVVQEAVVGAHAALQASGPLVEQTRSAWQSAQARLDSAQEAAGGWPKPG